MSPSPIRTDSSAFFNTEMSSRGRFGGTLCNTHGNLHSYIMKYAVYTVFMLLYDISAKRTSHSDQILIHEGTCHICYCVIGKK